MTSPRSQLRGTATCATRAQLARLEAGEHLGAREQAGGLLPGGHVRIMTAWQSHVKP